MLKISDVRGNMWLNRREDSVHRKRKRELQNVRTEYKQVSTRREHLVVSIIFEWEWKCRIYRTLKWLGGFVCRPASRAEVDNAVWAGMREREGREGERESEREKHLMTQGRWAPLEKQEYIYRQQKKQNSWCITYYNRVFFFSMRWSKWKCSGNQWIDLTLRLLAGKYCIIGYRWLWFVCFFFEFCLPINQVSDSIRVQLFFSLHFTQCRILPGFWF